MTLAFPPHSVQAIAIARNGQLLSHFFCFKTASHATAARGHKAACSSMVATLAVLVPALNFNLRLRRRQRQIHKLGKRCLHKHMVTHLARQTAFGTNPMAASPVHHIQSVESNDPQWMLIRNLKTANSQDQCETGPSPGIGRIVSRMYTSFNSCDADGTSECFTVNAVYEDLLLGSPIIVESREELCKVLRLHPVFLWRRSCEQLKMTPTGLQVKVDNVCEDNIQNTLIVDWHVEVGGKVLPLGRGFSFMHICRSTGLIRHTVDVAELSTICMQISLACILQGAVLWDAFCHMLPYSFSQKQVFHLIETSENSCVAMMVIIAESLFNGFGFGIGFV